MANINFGVNLLIALANSELANLDLTDIIIIFYLEGIKVQSYKPSASINSLESIEKNKAYWIVSGSENPMVNNEFTSSSDFIDNLGASNQNNFIPVLLFI